MSSGGYRLEPVEALSPAAMAGLRRIYEEGFPPHERAGFADVTAARRADELALALVGDGEPYGFALLRPLGHTGWIYLRYLVVDGARRSQGLGGQLWGQLTGRLADEGYTLLIWDVEDPDEEGRDPGDAEPVNTEQRWRRIRFYQRNGGSLLPVTGYRTPDAAPGGAGWSPMRLMTAPLASDEAAEPAAVVAAVFRYRWELAPGQFPVVRVHEEAAE